MRRIKSKQVSEKKQKKRQTILGIILIVVMFGSVFGIIVNSFGDKSSSEITYNGFKFTNQNNYWYTQIGNLEFLFKYLPDKEDNNSKTELKPLSNYPGKILYLYSEDYESEIEIYRNVEPYIQRKQYACLDEISCNGDYPVKDCSENFIIIKESNETKIYQEENCVFILGKKENLAKLTDEFLFEITGIQ
jgi:hypothetical protein